MSKYAAATAVPTGRTRAELEATIRCYGGDDIVTGESARSGVAFVAFTYEGLHVKLDIPLPSPGEERFTSTPSGRRQRTAAQARGEWEKACRQQWRVLLLLVKAALEACENEVKTPGEVFMPWILLPTGRTLYQELAGQLSEIARTGAVPKLLCFTPPQEEPCP